ncbi:uncharacterized protein LOC135928937 isoform X1 [Gordionus sp. m RMFG-2023]|uniref:uncharacterized protein LOC135928937 isoform X1 n=1 Tax=Gordionus sp. m RMFG-2023 TaxID=3053472 RepID=UPI0031FC08DE
MNNGKLRSIYIKNIANLFDNKDEIFNPAIKEINSVSLVKKIFSGLLPFEFAKHPFNKPLSLECFYYDDKALITTIENDLKITVGILENDHTQLDKHTFEIADYLPFPIPHQPWDSPASTSAITLKILYLVENVSATENLEENGEGMMEDPQNSATLLPVIRPYLCLILPFATCEFGIPNSILLLKLILDQPTKMGKNDGIDVALVKHLTYPSQALYKDITLIKGNVWLSVLDETGNASILYRRLNDSSMIENDWLKVCTPSLLRPHENVSFNGYSYSDIADVVFSPYAFRSQDILNAFKIVTKGKIHITETHRRQKRSELKSILIATLKTLIPSLISDTQVYDLDLVLQDVLREIYKECLLCDKRSSIPIGFCRQNFTLNSRSNHSGSARFSPLTILCSGTRLPFNDAESLPDYSADNLLDTNDYDCLPYASSIYPTDHMEEDEVNSFRILMEKLLQHVDNTESSLDDVILQNYFPLLYPNTNKDNPFQKIKDCRNVIGGYVDRLFANPINLLKVKDAFESLFPCYRELGEIIRKLSALSSKTFLEEDFCDFPLTDGDSAMADDENMCYDALNGDLSCKYLLSVVLFRIKFQFLPALVLSTLLQEMFKHFHSFLHLFDVDQTRDFEFTEISKVSDSDTLRNELEDATCAISVTLSRLFYLTWFSGVVMVSSDTRNSKNLAKQQLELLKIDSICSISDHEDSASPNETVLFDLNKTLKQQILAHSNIDIENSQEDHEADHIQILQNRILRYIWPCDTSKFTSPTTSSHARHLESNVYDIVFYLFAKCQFKTLITYIELVKPFLNSRQDAHFFNGQVSVIKEASLNDTHKIGNFLDFFQALGLLNKYSVSQTPPDSGRFEDLELARKIFLRISYDIPGNDPFFRNLGIFDPIPTIPTTRNPDEVREEGGIGKILNIVYRLRYFFKLIGVYDILKLSKEIMRLLQHMIVQLDACNDILAKISPNHTDRDGLIEYLNQVSHKLWSTKFKYSMEEKDFNSAFAAIQRHTDYPTRVDCLRVFLNTLYAKNVLEVIARIEYDDLYQEATDILKLCVDNRQYSIDSYSNGSSTMSIQEIEEVINESGHNFLYAFYVDHGDLTSALSIMMELALKCGNLVKNVINTSSSFDDYYPVFISVAQVMARALLTVVNGVNIDPRIKFVPVVIQKNEKIRDDKLVELMDSNLRETEDAIDEKAVSSATKPLDYRDIMTFYLLVSSLLKLEIVNPKRNNASQTIELFTDHIIGFPPINGATSVTVTINGVCDSLCVSGSFKDAFALISNLIQTKPSPNEIIYTLLETFFENLAKVCSILEINEGSLVKVRNLLGRNYQWNWLTDSTAEESRSLMPTKNYDQKAWNIARRHLETFYDSDATSTFFKVARKSFGRAVVSMNVPLPIWLIQSYKLTPESLPELLRHFLIYQKFDESYQTALLMLDSKLGVLNEPKTDSKKVDSLCPAYISLQPIQFLLHLLKTRLDNVINDNDLSRLDTYDYYENLHSTLETKLMEYVNKSEILARNRI